MTLMLNILSFVAGMIVMDLMWAYKLGLVQTVYNRVRSKFIKS